MNSSTCSNKVRKNISNVVKQRLANHSHFACSICGSIPIVFHHIEEWAESQSNDENLLIPICDNCHRRIHGEGGALFSKEDLYNYKANPKKPPKLLDNLPLERKRTYSFFVGSNFQADGEKASLFEFEKGHHLISIDTSEGILKLNILISIVNEKAKYLIKDNQLMIDTQDIWNMQYSGNSLKIWKDQRNIFIELIIKPDIIIIKRLDTSFNGKPFRVYKQRKKSQSQIKKINEEIKKCEDLYYSRAADVDVKYNNHSEHIKQNIKDSNKTHILRYLSNEYCKKFNWTWTDYQLILDKLLSDSPVFKRDRDHSKNLPTEISQLSKQVALIKEKYKYEFEELKDTFVEYNSNKWMTFIDYR